MTLTAAEVQLLEDCQDDWQGLWEAGWVQGGTRLEERVALVSGLVERGLLNVLRINDWPDAKGAPSLPKAGAIAVVIARESYAAPEEGHTGPFHVLAITQAGEVAVSER